MAEPQRTGTTRPAATPAEGGAAGAGGPGADGPTDGYVVKVRPEQVVEIAFDGVQHSPRYRAGMALRSARVLHHRPDKPADQADTVEQIRAIHQPE